MRSLNIVHVFRAPVGGLFRHVLDLARGQAARGHRVGLICDTAGGDEPLARIAPDLALGLTRLPMSRNPGAGDLIALARIGMKLAGKRIDVLHGHGAKGGLFSRLTPAGRALRVYTPHGGSLHYGRDTLAGRLYGATERFLMPRTGLFLFESGYSADVFRQKIGAPSALLRVVPNGVQPEEFEPVTLTADASDIVFLGEMRLLKGVDVLIDAIARLKRDGRVVTARLVGDGPDIAAFRSRAETLGLGARVQFLPPMPARRAFSLGTVVAMPSRAESLPYVVLEAAAAAKPLIASRTGGIPEIYGALSDALVAPGDVRALADAIARKLDQPDQAIRFAEGLRTRIGTHFSAKAMIEGVLSGYEAALPPEPAKSPALSISRRPT